MDLTSKSARALRFAARLADRAEKGEDLGDSMSIDRRWSGKYTGATHVQLHVWYDRDDRTIAERVLDIRKALGGSFEKNDPKADDWSSSYASLSRIEEDFVVAIITDRAATCRRIVVSTEVVEHEAVAAWSETREVVAWDCEPLNDSAVSLVKAGA